MFVFGVCFVVLWECRMRHVRNEVVRRYGFVFGGAAGSGDTVMFIASCFDLFVEPVAGFP